MISVDKNWDCAWQCWPAKDAFECRAAKNSYSFNDNSKGIYQGKIFVDSKAQKTDGYQLSRALLLNEDTEFNAKPELEIYADDVKCSHGSTSGNIDENSIFYLMSRGLTYKQSKQLLINGYVAEVVEKITDNDIKDFVKKLLGISDEY